MAQHETTSAPAVPVRPRPVRTVGAARAARIGCAPRDSVPDTGA
jgi:hypothetical protein